MHNKPVLSASTGHSGPFKHTLSLRGCLELLAPAISPPAPAPSQALKLWQRNKKALSMINRWAKLCQSRWVWGRDRCTCCPRRHTPSWLAKTWWNAQRRITGENLVKWHTRLHKQQHLINTGKASSTNKARKTKPDPISYPRLCFTSVRCDLIQGYFLTNWHPAKETSKLSCNKSLLTF